MKDKILSKLTGWYNSGDKEILTVGERIDYLNEKLFGDYEPALGPKPNFESRLEKWIENVTSDADQKTLLRLVPEIFYIGKNEFDTLYRIAYNTVTVRWLVDLYNIKFDGNINNVIKEKLQKVWFCPITDSMRINQFYHLNSVQKGDKRPEWRSLEAFGSIDKISDYIKDNKFECLVLLEDFVGSGNQIKKSVEFAAKNFPNINILVIPHIMCPKAETIMDELQTEFLNVKILPVMKLREDLFVLENREKNSSFFKSLFDLAKAQHPKMKNDGFKWPFLGFRKIGGVIVLYSNTPNNSMPIIWSSSNWNPLFNRHVR